MSRSLTRSLLLVATLIAHPAAAQRVLGPWQDASTLRPGQARLRVGLWWDRANERYDANGVVRSLGASASSWDGTYDPRLAAAAPLVSTLSGLSSFNASLGALTLGRRDASNDAPVGLDLGVTRWLTVGASTRVVSHAIEAAASINPSRTGATMGLNPAWTIPASATRNGTIVSQFDSANAQLGRRAAQCAATPSGTGCTAINAASANVQQLLTNAGAFANALATLYGGRGKNGLPFVPTAGSQANAAIGQRLAGFRDQFTQYGINGIAGDAPVAAVLLGPTDFAKVIGDSLYGYVLRPVRNVHAYGLAGTELHGKVKLFDNTGTDTAAIDGFKWRQSVGAQLRLGGATAPSADEVFAPVAGDVSGGVTAETFTDLFYGTRWAATIQLGYSTFGSSEYEMRVPDAAAPAVGGVAWPLLTATRVASVSRSPAGRLDISVAPRVAVGRDIWFGAAYAFHQQGAESWNLRSTGAATASDAAHWAAGTDWSSHEVALGGSYSTLRAQREGRASLGFDLSYEHRQVLTGRGVAVAKVSADVVTLRWYPRLWGRRTR